MIEKCSKCGKEFETNLAWKLGIVVCKKCAGPPVKLVKREQKRGSKSNVDRAFENMGLSDKTLKEHGLTKKKILEELAGGVKPKEEVVQTGGGGRLGKFGTK